MLTFIIINIQEILNDNNNLWVNCIILFNYWEVVPIKKTNILKSLSINPKIHKQFKTDWQLIYLWKNISDLIL